MQTVGKALPGLRSKQFNCLTSEWARCAAAASRLLVTEELMKSDSSSSKASEDQNSMHMHVWHGRTASV